MSKDDESTPDKAKFEANQPGKRTFPNRQAAGILAKEVIDAVRASKTSEFEKEKESGPNVVVREVKDLVKEINSRIQDAKKEKDSEGEGKGKTKEKAEEYGVRRRSTVSTTEPEREGSNLRRGWKLNSNDELVAISEDERNVSTNSNKTNNNNSTNINFNINTSTNNSINNNNNNTNNNSITNNNNANNTPRKRAWTRGTLALSEGSPPLLSFPSCAFCARFSFTNHVVGASPIVGRRGNSLGQSHGVRIGNNLASSNALGEENANLKAKLAAMEQKNEENLQLLDEARNKLEKAASCVHSLLRKTQVRASLLFYILLFFFFLWVGK